MAPASTKGLWTRPFSFSEGIRTSSSSVFSIHWVRSSLVVFGLPPWIMKPEMIRWKRVPS